MRVVIITMIAGDVEKGSVAAVADALDSRLETDEIDELFGADGEVQIEKTLQGARRHEMPPDQLVD